MGRGDGFLMFKLLLLLLLFFKEVGRRGEGVAGDCLNFLVGVGRCLCFFLVGWGSMEQRSHLILQRLSELA